MYRSRLWTMRQYAGYGTAEESNRRYRYLLAQGTTGLSIAFDLPTQLGLDSDHAEAAFEVGRVGVAVDSAVDMEALFENIPLESVSTSMTINATAAILLAMYLSVARKQEARWARLRGTLQNDILKEYVARGTYIYPPPASMRLVTDVMQFCRRQVPLWNTISVSGYHIREAGATAAQEIAFTLANGETYVRAGLEAGLSVDEFSPRLSFFFSAHNDLLEEVSKFRAARRIWARLMKETFGTRDERSAMLRFHTQTAGSTLTAQQPENNVVRVAYQALAAVLGGTQSLHTNAKDEALGLPTTEAAKLALRTQQVLAHESNIARSVDPLGGSWLVEKLTADLEEEAQEYLREIRSIGGVLAAIESGYIQREIQDSAYRQQKRFEAAEEIVVGVNKFVEDRDVCLEITHIDEGLVAKQIEQLRRRKEKRDQALFGQALDQVRESAASKVNTMPAILGAVEADATIGEISAALGDVFGWHKETIVI
jgi:methylmalonyl-CoA mutase N-terminal domain/subunit